MENFRSAEAPHHVEDRIHFADVGEKLVSQSFARAGTADDPGDIDDAQGGGNDLFGLDELIDHVQPGIRHRDHADVGLDGGERVVGRQRARRRQALNKRAFADVRQSDNSNFQ